MITKCCPICKTEFETYPSLNQKCCSKACANESQKCEKVERHCDQCGAAFLLVPSQVKKGTKFCSRSCYEQSVAAKKHLICKECGTSFDSYSSQRKHFCSWSCFRAWQGKNKFTDEERKRRNSESTKRYWAENVERKREKERAHTKRKYRRAKIEPAFRMKWLVSAARRRARIRGLPFDRAIEATLIAYPPKKCACCGKVFGYEVDSATRDRPTLDRMDNALGYILGNVEVICFRCNWIKNDAAVEELMLIMSYMSRSRGKIPKVA